MANSNSRRRKQPGSHLQDIDVRRAERLVMRLMGIPGPSGREGRIARFIVSELKKRGVPAKAIQFDRAHERTPLAGEVGNLVLRLPGSKRQPRRLLSAHMDTVPICVGSKPTKRGQMVRSAAPNTGLGADDRAGCAVLLATACEILERKLPCPPLTFCWFVQEEIGLQGARVATRSLWGQPKLAFNWDGGNPAKLTIGATGGYRLLIDVEGIASHAGGAPEEGISAIAIAALAIADLQRDGWHGDIRKAGHRGTSNVGVIQGGAATNVVTDRVQIRAEARSHDPAFRRQIVDRIVKSFEAAAAEITNVAQATGRVRVESRLDYEAFLLPLDAPCIQVAEAAVRGIGLEPERAVANGGLDANWITAHGIPSVSLGCGQENQHMVTESLDLRRFAQACRIALRIATGQDSE